MFHRQNSTVCGVLIPYRLVLLCLLGESFPSLLALQVDLFALQLLHGRLIFLLGLGAGGVWFVLSSPTSGFSRYTVSADHKITSEALPTLPTPTFTLLWCSSCTVCSCIRASASASLACPVEIGQKKWCSVVQLMVTLLPTAYCTFKKKGAICKNRPAVTFSLLRMSYCWTLIFWALKIPGPQTKPANLRLCARLTIRGIK